MSVREYMVDQKECKETHAAKYHNDYTTENVGNQQETTNGQVQCRYCCKLTLGAQASEMCGVEVEVAGKIFYKHTTAFQLVVLRGERGTKVVEAQNKEVKNGKYYRQGHWTFEK